MSLSCHSATFSRAGTTAARTSRASPVRFSARIGLRLWGMAEEPFWALPKASSASAISVRCKWRISTARRSMEAAARARAAKKAAWRSRGITWVETGSGLSPSPAATWASTLGSTVAKVPTAPRDRAGRDLPACRQQPAPGALELGVKAGELEAEGGGLGVDAVAAPDAWGGRVLAACAAPARSSRASRSSIRRSAARVSCTAKARIEHVRGGQAPVQEAGLVADMLGDIGEEGDDVVAGLRARSRRCGPYRSARGAGAHGSRPAARYPGPPWPRRPGSLSPA